MVGIMTDADSMTQTVNPLTASPLFMQKQRNKYPYLTQFKNYFEKTLKRSELSSARIDMRKISNLNLCCGHHGDDDQYSTILKSTITVHSNFSDQEDDPTIVHNQTITSISDDEFFEDHSHSVISMSISPVKQNSSFSRFGSASQSNLVMPLDFKTVQNMTLKSIGVDHNQRLKMYFTTQGEEWWELFQNNLSLTTPKVVRTNLEHLV